MTSVMYLGIIINNNVRGEIMNDKLEFRYATQDDIDLVYTFIKKLADYEGMPEAVKASKEMIEDWMFTRNKAEVLFAMIDAKEIGFSLFYESFAAYVGKGGIFIDDLYIEPEYRGKGYGKQLLKKMAEIALERECGRLEWLCLRDNLPSMEFYKRMGAKMTDECVVFRVTGDALNTLYFMTT